VPEPPDEMWLVRGVPIADIKGDGQVYSAHWNHRDGISVWMITEEAVAYVLSRTSPPILLQAVLARTCRQIGAMVKSEESHDPNAPPGQHYVIELGHLSNTQRKKAGQALRDHAARASISVDLAATAAEMREYLLAAIERAAQTD
jgi:hypothetical protein